MAKRRRRRRKLVEVEQLVADLLRLSVTKRPLTEQAAFSSAASMIGELVALVDDLTTCVVCHYFVTDDDIEAVVTRARKFLARDPYEELDDLQNLYDQ